MLTEVPGRAGVEDPVGPVPLLAGSAEEVGAVVFRATSRSSAGASADALAVSPRMAGKRRQAHAGRRARRAARDSAAVVDLLNHELRTPLTTVVGFTELVRSGEAGTLNHDQEHLLRRVEAGAQSLQDLVEALLRVTTDEIAAGGTPQVAEVVRRVLDERAALHDALAGSRRATA